MPITHSGQVIANLDGVPDVVITSPVNGQMLVYNSATGLWENGTPAGGGDMLKSLYDTDNDGKVDTSNDVSNAPLITRTSVTALGGLRINIDAATGDIARTTSGVIEDGKFDIQFDRIVAGSSGEFDTAVTRVGVKTLKLSTTDITGTCRAIKGYVYAFLIKPSTKYRLACWCKTNNVAVGSAFLAAQEYNSAVGVIAGTFTNWTSSALSGTNDWTSLQKVVTTNAAAAVFNIFFYNAAAGNISDAWYDLHTLTLDEVIEPVADTLTSSSPSLVSLKAVGNADSLLQDQRQITSNNQRLFGGDGSMVDLPTKIAMQIIPSRSKFAGIILRRLAVGSFTGTVTISVQGDSGTAPNGTIYAAYTYSNAAWLALTLDTDFTVPLPCNLTIGSNYYIVAEASTSSATDCASLRSTTAFSNYAGIFKGFYSGAWNTVNHDLYFRTTYYRPTTNFKASQNNKTVSLSTDEDGFLNTGVYNLLTGVFSFKQTDDALIAIGAGNSMVPNLYSYSTTTANGTADSLYTSGNTVSMKGSSVGTVVATYKIPMASLSSILVTGCVRYAKAEWAYDNATWNTIYDNTATLSEIAISQSIPKSGSFVYLKFTSGNAANASYIGTTTNPFIITGVVDTAYLSTLRNYPTNKDVITTYQKSLAAATTSATYRATKWGFPAIEYSATEYQFLDIDTTATGSTVAFSSNGSAYTTVADGASLAIASTTTPLLWVKTNITANRLYISSNDYTVSSSKDGGNKMAVTYDVISQGLGYDVIKMKNKIDTLEQAVYALQHP